MKLRIRAYNLWDVSYFVCPDGQIFRSLEGLPPRSWATIQQDCENVPWVGF